MTDGDELPAKVMANVDVTLGEQGDQLLEVLNEVRAATSDLAVAREKINEAGYDILISTNDAGVMIIKIVDE